MNQQQNIELDAKNCNTVNNSEVTKIPQWLNEEYVAKFLRENLEIFEKIIMFSIELASQKGENYTSSLYRINVDIMLTNETTTSHSYIMKVPLPAEESDVISSMPNLFVKEIAMYSEILPRFKKLYEDQGVHTVLAPEYYKLPVIAGVDPGSLILEDLGANRFSLQDRLEGLNLKYTENVLNKLAEFHAASARYIEVYGPYPDMFDEHMFTEESRALYENIKIDYFNEYIKEYKGHEEYQDLIPVLLEKFLDLNIGMGAVDHSEFNVLNHGDCWLNNILFQHDSEGNLIDSRFIDFQLCKYGSPTLDLYMFLLSGTQLDIKIKYFDYFVKFYHDQLVKNLKLLKYEGKIPHIKEFHGLMFKYGFTGFASFFYCLTICLLDPESGNDPNADCFIDDSPESDRTRRAMFLNNRFKAHADIIMPWLARRGFLE